MLFNTIMITIDDYNYKFKTIIKSTVDKHKDMYEALILECYWYMQRELYTTIILNNCYPPESHNPNCIYLLRNSNCVPFVHGCVFRWGLCCSSFQFHVLCAMFLVLFVFVLYLVSNVAHVSWLSITNLNTAILLADQPGEKFGYAW